MTGLESFNSLPASEAEDELHACFANRAWAARVASGRPYPNLEMLFAAAEEAWSELSAGDWLRAFAAHPRIGEVGGHAPAASEREQSGVRQASAKTLTALASENRRYEDRFGHVFLIAASGRGADDCVGRNQSIRRHATRTGCATKTFLRAPPEERLCAEDREQGRLKELPTLWR